MWLVGRRTFSKGYFWQKCDDVVVSYYVNLRHKVRDTIRIELGFIRRPQISVVV